MEDSSVSKVRGWKLDDEVSIPGRFGISFPLPSCSERLWDPLQLPVQWLSWNFSQGVKAAGASCTRILNPDTVVLKDKNIFNFLSF